MGTTLYIKLGKILGVQRWELIRVGAVASGLERSLGTRYRAPPRGWTRDWVIRVYLVWSSAEDSRLSWL